MQKISQLQWIQSLVARNGKKSPKEQRCLLKIEWTLIYFVFPKICYLDAWENSIIKIWSIRYQTEVNFIPIIDASCDKIFTECSVKLCKILSQYFIALHIWILLYLTTFSILSLDLELSSLDPLLFRQTIFIQDVVNFKIFLL